VAFRKRLIKLVIYSYFAITVTPNINLLTLFGRSSCQKRTLQLSVIISIIRI